MTKNGSLEKKIVLALLLGLTCVSPNAYAEEESGQNSTEPKYTLEAITVEATRPDWESKLSPGTVTVIRPDDYQGEQKTLPELLKQVPGVHVRELNGKGQYTTVSVRGSTAAQVGVFVDGVLFNLGGDAAADISTIPVQNVERIEVYRGYIPARFGGTFMGGVINVVTKRPTKSNVQASIGQSSFGGYKGSLQLDSPLGSGSLMVGVNHEESDGDFKYKNISYDIDKNYQQMMSTASSYQQNTIYYYDDAIEKLGIKDENGDVPYIEPVYSDGSTAADYKKNYEDNISVLKTAWDKYGAKIDAILADNDALLLLGLQNNYYFTNYNDLNALYDTSATNQANMYQSLASGNKFRVSLYTLQQAGYTVTDYSSYISAYNSYKQTSFTSIQDILGNDWKDGTHGATFQDFLERWKGDSGSRTMEQLKECYEFAKKYYDMAGEASTSDRWRKSNDYKNTDAIIKWQDDHWLAKATWKKIKRHLPFPYNGNYSELSGVDTTPAFNTPLDIYYHRNQKLTAKEALVGRRDTVGNLEWGWSVDYLDQHKDYYVDNWQWIEENAGVMLQTYAANSLWSDFDSRRLGGKIDGSYKAGDKHLLEFLIDGSKEKMDINGWRMLDFKDSSQDTRSRWRNYYEQEILNAQVQDTITLNEKADFWLTPSIRYNRSTILGRSDRYDENNDPAKIKWYHQEDEQTNDKVTWQMALKKAVNDHLTLRATGGTYYRLLNMYEIAGDGAGILPMPNVGGTDSVFPLPEEGSQWDLSAIWDGKALGADSAKFQLTYFGRDSDHLLQLMNRHFYLFYTNAARAKVNGLEMQADMSWQKWDLNLQATYTKPTDVSYDMTCLPGYGKDTTSGFLTYMPEWEGTARVTYRPDKRWSMFTQLRYVADMYSDPLPLTTGATQNQSSLTVWDVGVKHQLNKSFQLAVGVNDMFNKAIDMFNKGYEGTISNIQYPIQGRTYYVTMQYNF